MLTDDSFVMDKSTVEKIVAPETLDKYFIFN